MVGLMAKQARLSQPSTRALGLVDALKIRIPFSHGYANVSADIRQRTATVSCASLARQVGTSELAQNRISQRKQVSLHSEPSVDFTLGLVLGDAVTLLQATGKFLPCPRSHRDRRW
jgi:hypothetical protein